MTGFKEDARARRELEGTIGRRILGVECPTRNKTGDVCKECERVKKLWRENTATAEEDARKRQSKDSYFLNIQKRDGTFTALKIGKKVAKSLKTKLERYRDKTGKAFGYANLDEGEWLAISKSGEKPNFEYDLEVLGEKAEPVDIADVKAMASLNNLTEDYHSGVLDLEDIASINSGDSYEFRMLPIPTGEDRATEMVYRYYHWFCSEADILGGEEVGDVVKTGADTPKEFREFMEIGATDDVEIMKDEEKKHTYTADAPPECFGHWDGEEDCMEPDCDIIRKSCATEAGYIETEEGTFIKKSKKKTK
jgi:hypothetical protein